MDTQPPTMNREYVQQLARVWYQPIQRALEWALERDHAATQAEATIAEVRKQLADIRTQLAETESWQNHHAQRFHA